jgi:hypothetical protein
MVANKNKDTSILVVPKVVVTFREDGYINATALCKIGGKLFGHWKPLSTTKRIIQILSEDTGIPIARLMDVKKGGNGKYLQGSWIHPRLAVNLAQWISTSFSLEVSQWIDEWKEYDIQNKTRFSEALNRITPEDKNTQQEREIQSRLHHDLGGETEVKTRVGYVDLLTDTEVIEIKHASEWKHGLGQVLSYSRYIPGVARRLHLFGECSTDAKDIEDTCKDFEVSVTYED